MNLPRCLLVWCIIGFSAAAFAVSESPEYYANLATQSAPPESYIFTLQASDAALKQNQLSKTESLLKELPEELPMALVLYRQILLSEIRLSQNKLNDAILPLKSLNPTVVSAELQERYYRLLADAYLRQNNPLESVKQRIFLDYLLQEEPNALVKNRETIWKTLMQIPLHTLKRIRMPSPPDVLGGWLALAYINKYYESAVDRDKAISAWKRTYPNHPANQILTQKMSAYSASKELKQVALLLPLGEGPHQNAAEAILEGFVSSFYASSQRPLIRIYDTTQDSAKKQYRQAVQEGADWIVGPLTKQEVDEIAALSPAELSTPTLLLNMPKSLATDAPLYTFALNPESEGIRLAQRLSQDGFKRIALVSSPDSVQQRTVDAFVQQWQQLNGKIVASKVIQANADHALSIRQLLQIDTLAAKAKTLKQTTGATLPLQERRRQDIDAVVLLANTEQMHLIRPLFDFYYAQDLPIYTTTHFYNGVANTETIRDMNHIIFADMPWILAKQDAIHPSMADLKAIWPKTIRQEPRLAAFGIDAYRLATQSSQWQTYPQMGLVGATGILYPNENHMIERQLAWATLRNGVPQLL